MADSTVTTTVEIMMTSSNRSVLLVTGPLWAESTGDRRILIIKVRDAELWCFLWSAPEQTVEPSSRRQWFETPLRSLWRRCNVGQVFSRETMSYGRLLWIVLGQKYLLQRIYQQRTGWSIPVWIEWQCSNTLLVCRNAFPKRKQSVYYEPKLSISTKSVISENYYKPQFHIYFPLS